MVAAGPVEGKTPDSELGRTRVSDTAYGLFLGVAGSQVRSRPTWLMAAFLAAREASGLQSGLRKATANSAESTDGP